MNRITRSADPERAKFDRGFRDGLADHLIARGLDRAYEVEGHVRDAYVDGYRRGHLAGQQAEESMLGALTSADAWEDRIKEGQR